MPEQMMRSTRSWNEIAFLSLGFRPFFLLGAVWAALAMVLWIAFLTGIIAFEMTLAGTDWHAHALLFGYLPAIVAGFLLTAMPNWTGRAPMRGAALAGLVLLWGAGRLACLSALPLIAIAVIDMAFLPVLAAYAAREVIAARNRRNLVVVALLAVLALANFLFHLDSLRGYPAADGAGARLALAGAVLLICLIGGRVTPSFTRNWLMKSGRVVGDPAWPGIDMPLLVVTGMGLLLWVFFPDQLAVALLFAVLGLLHLLRLSRWNGHRSAGEPLVAILHVGYLFVPLGFLAVAVQDLFPDRLDPMSAQHVWMAGAVGVMTLAIMTRASLGHTGRALTAGGGTVAIFGFALVSVLSRLLAGVFPSWAMALYSLSAAAWIAAFLAFALLFGPSLMTPRPDW